MKRIIISVILICTLFCNSVFAKQYQLFVGHGNTIDEITMDAYTQCAKWAVRYHIASVSNLMPTGQIVNCNLDGKHYAMAFYLEIG